MGRILSFMPRQAAPGRPPNTGGFEAAVIIFPGVRYERSGEGDARAQAVSVARAQPSSGKPEPRH